jgi:GTP:adenosylcobinamide-phosphate guanylyltransferase
MNTIISAFVGFFRKLALMQGMKYIKLSNKYLLLKINTFMDTAKSGKIVKTSCGKHN